jgi:hypothetical protein
MTSVISKSDVVDKDVPKKKTAFLSLFAQNGRSSPE